MRQFPMFAILGSLILFTANSADADSYYGGHSSYGYGHGSVSHGDYGHASYGHGNYGHSYYGPAHSYGYGYDNGRCAERRYRSYRGRGCDNFGFRDGGQRRTGAGNCPGGRCFDRPLPIGRRDPRFQQQTPRTSPTAPGRPQNKTLPRGRNRTAPKTTIPPVPGLVPPNQEQGAPVPNTNMNP
jgi:hypothetical protein